MTVYEIVKKHLEEHGFDGLFNSDGECACLASELAPCGGEIADCEPGYRVDGCTCGQGCDFHIRRKKPTKV